MSHFEFYLTAFGDASPCEFTPLTIGGIRDDDLKTIRDRMTSFTEYSQRKPSCRMQNPEFRENTSCRSSMRGSICCIMLSTMKDNFLRQNFDVSATRT